MSFVSSVCKIYNLNNDFWHRIFTSLPFAPHNKKEVQNIAFYTNIFITLILVFNVVNSNNVFSNIVAFIFLMLTNSMGIFFWKDFNKEFEYKCLSILSFIPTATIFLVVLSFIFNAFERLNLIEVISLSLHIFINFVVPMNKHNLYNIESKKT